MINISAANPTQFPQPDLLDRRRVKMRGPFRFRSTAGRIALSFSRISID